mmetsp:Transcript_73528/g.198863  ORF Transcript_73528/g.198863 Transcript_73528/m.198863 type:complete len:238 (+) Transcript_73528:461-1174(+)
MVQEWDERHVEYLHHDLDHGAGVDVTAVACREADGQPALHGDQAVGQDNAQHQQMHVGERHLGIRVSEYQADGATGLKNELVQLRQDEVPERKLVLEGQLVYDLADPHPHNLRLRCLLAEYLQLLDPQQAHVQELLEVLPRLQALGLRVDQPVREKAKPKNTLLHLPMFLAWHLDREKQNEVIDGAPEATDTILSDAPPTPEERGDKHTDHETNQGLKVAGHPLKALRYVLHGAFPH